MCMYSYVFALFPYQAIHFRLFSFYYVVIVYKLSYGFIDGAAIL